MAFWCRCSIERLLLWVVFSSDLCYWHDWCGIGQFQLIEAILYWQKSTQSEEATHSLQVAYDALPSHAREATGCAPIVLGYCELPNDNVDLSSTLQQSFGSSYNQFQGWKSLTVAPLRSQEITHLHCILSTPRSEFHGDICSRLPHIRPTWTNDASSLRKYCYLRVSWPLHTITNDFFTSTDCLGTIESWSFHRQSCADTTGCLSRSTKISKECGLILLDPYLRQTVVVTPSHDLALKASPCVTNHPCGGFLDFLYFFNHDLKPPTDWSSSLSSPWPHPTWYRSSQPISVDLPSR